ncbi:succinylglutamate desuccinylase [Klebsiella pneumoniae]|uniref:Succinylglutamate desuccinylase n=1 Tax=Klebsiella pneumoniae TaxID=573 RepID=A0A4P0Y3K2_KLEPN|nr:succinylglutamate desuccinylase [Klebsiella pneumoniae]
MEHFLALTLAGRLPHHFHGETAHFRWHWLGEGILELTPHARCERGLVLSCAIHGNETAPVEIVDQLVQRLVREALPLRWRLLVIVGNPPALRANKRYLHSDMNRMFGERWRQFPLSEETQRTQRLEQAVARFYRDHDGRAGTSICIPRSAGRYIRASACSRPAIRRGRRIFFTGWAAPGWRRWCFIASPAGPSPTSAANGSRRWPAPLSWAKRCRWGKTI